MQSVVRDFFQDLPVRVFEPLTAVGCGNALWGSMQMEQEEISFDDILSTNYGISVTYPDTVQEMKKQWMDFQNSKTSEAFEFIPSTHRDHEFSIILKKGQKIPASGQNK